MSTYTLKAILAMAALFVIFLISKNLFALINKRDTKLDKKRGSQLKFDEKRTSSQDMTMDGLVDTVTGPVKKYVMPKVTVDETRTEKLEKDIQLADWKGFDAYTFQSLDLTLKILGIVMGLLFLTKSTFMAILWFTVLFFGLRFLFNNSISNRKYNLMAEFPDFIRITQGFLSSNMTLVESLENALPYVGPTWRPILQDFIIEANIYSQDECIEQLKERVPIFEVHELWSLIQLNLEQGIDIKESFNNQAEKVKSMQKEVMIGKIGKRQMMATVIQAPLMLCMMGGFMLPTLSQMINLDMG
jgi:Flp pilus assembly protein TadB